MSLLSIIQRASLASNILPAPSAAFTSVDPQIAQLVEFATKTGEELVERSEWRNLKMGGQLTGDGVTTLFMLPADWQRFCPSSNSQNSPLVSLARPTIPIIGPIKDEDLNMRKALPMATIFPVWRLIGGTIEIWPALADGETISFSYYSKYWIANSDASSRFDAWTSDTDVSLIPERLIILGAVWRYKRSKGLDYAEEFREYELAISRATGQQDMGRSVSTTAQRPWPDNYWPGVITPPTST